MLKNLYLKKINKLHVINAFLVVSITNKITSSAFDFSYYHLYGRKAHSRSNLSKFDSLRP